MRRTWSRFFSLSISYWLTIDTALCAHSQHTIIRGLGGVSVCKKSLYQFGFLSFGGGLLRFCLLPLYPLCSLGSDSSVLQLGLRVQHQSTTGECEPTETGLQRSYLMFQFRLLFRLPFSSQSLRSSNRILLTDTLHNITANKQKSIQKRCSPRTG